MREREREREGREVLNDSRVREREQGKVKGSKSSHNSINTVPKTMVQTKKIIIKIENFIGKY